jgi:hypothetical protein
VYVRLREIAVVALDGRVEGRERFRLGGPFGGLMPAEL